MRVRLILFFYIISISVGFSQIPAGYYDSAQGLEGDALKQALYDIIKNHTEKSYGDARYILDETDRDPNNSANVRVIYSPHSVDGTWDNGASWNREHVWSVSRGMTDPDNNDYGPSTDLHNLRACVPDVNTAKSNRWFAECSTKYYYNSTWTGSYYAGADWDAAQFYWKPRDEDKGDVARILFYMATRYEGESGEPDLELINYIPVSNSTTAPNYALFEDLYQWHLDDPVDDFERNRNNVIYSYQNNRNPYIDHPEWVESAFESTMNLSDKEKEAVVFELYPNPSDEQITIKGLSYKLDYEYSIYDIKGSLISKGELKTETLNVSYLEEGIYCLTVLNISYINNHLITLRFVKE